MTAKEQYIAWFNTEKEKGMLSMHISLDPSRSDYSGITEEAIYEEFMRMVNGTVVENRELL